MAFDLSNASNILKVRYIGPIREQLNGATVLLSRIMRDDSSFNVSGKTFTVPIHTARNTAAGIARADGGTLPTAGQQGYQVAVVPNSYTYSRIKVTGPTIRAARDNAGAFVTAIESEIKGVTRDTKRIWNMYLNGDGTGAMAYWTTADDSSGTTVDDNQGNAFVHLPAAGTFTCDLIDASDHSTVLGNGIVVTLGAKAATNYAITWTGSVSGSADGDYLIPDDSVGLNPMGIRGIIDDGNPPTLSGGLHGLAVASHPYWKAQVFTGASAGTKEALTLSRMQEPLSGIAINSDFDESDVKFLLSNYNVRDKYVSLLVADKRHVNTMELDGGFKGVEFNGIPLVPDPQTDRSKIYYVVPESLRIFRTSDFDWADRDGSVLSRVANEDAYEAFLFAYQNLGCIARNANAVLEDITD
jgi:hypothetical protein